MPRLLEGIRVLDLSSIWAAPLGTRWLADMGAEVIKVQEVPKLTPQMIQRMQAMQQAQASGARSPAAGGGGYVQELEGNKRSISLDFETPKGQELLKRLVVMSDVLVDNHRPVVLERSHLDYEDLRQIKPDIIVVRVTAMGASGPERNYSGFGATIDGLSGLAFHTGYPYEDEPMRSGINYADPVVGMHVGGAVMLALVHRQRTGEGQHVDVALRESTTTQLGELFMDYSLNHRFAPRLGNRELGLAPHGAYRTRGEDRWITIAVNSDEEWRALSRVMGGPDWTQEERFRDMHGRWQNHDELDALISDWTQGQDATELAERLQAAGVAATPVLTVPEIFNTPQHQARDWWHMMPQPDGTSYHYYGRGWTLSETPVELLTPPPPYGQDNRSVYQGLLGLSDAEYAQLVEEKVVSESQFPTLPPGMTLPQAGGPSPRS